MEDQFSRTERLLGKEAMDILKKSRVAVFGIGGVGGHAAEALIRCGVGAIDLIDNDQVTLSNLNRQIIATHSSIGQYKVDVMKARLLDICPDVLVTTHQCFFLPQNSGDFDFSQYSYVVDAVDTVTAKIELVLKAQQAGTPIISSMGTGNKLDPTALKVADIYDTTVCPLAKVMRRELKKRNVEHLKVVYSKENPLKPLPLSEEADTNSEAEQIPGANSGQISESASKQISESTSKHTSEQISASTSKPADTKNPGDAPGSLKRRAVPGSVSFVPSVAGLLIAREVIKDLIKING